MGGTEKNILHRPSTVLHHLPPTLPRPKSVLLYSDIFAATGVQANVNYPRVMSSLNFSGLASGLDTSKRLAVAKQDFQLPGENDHLTFELPDEPPKDKKKKKKGKKGKKGSAKKKKKR